MGISLGATWANKGSTGAEPLRFHPKVKRVRFCCLLAASLSLCKGPENKLLQVYMYVGEKREKNTGPFLCPAGCVLMVFQCCVPPRRSAPRARRWRGVPLSLPASLPAPLPRYTGLHQHSVSVYTPAAAVASTSTLFTVAGESLRADFSDLDFFYFGGFTFFSENTSSRTEADVRDGTCCECGTLCAFVRSWPGDNPHFVVGLWRLKIPSSLHGNCILVGCISNLYFWGDKQQDLVTYTGEKSCTFCGGAWNRFQNF